MKRGLALCAVLMLFFVVPMVSADGNWSVDLVAGQNTPIGTVDFNITGDTLIATFNVTVPGWCLEVTHLYVSNVAPNSPAPGQFQYQHENLGCVQTDVFGVPTPDGDVFVAAHADSDYDPQRAVGEISNPDPISNNGTLVAQNGTDAYFNVELNIDGLNGTYEAWCIDLEHVIYTGQEYTANVDLSGITLVDRSENLDLIQYIVNQDYSSLGATTYDIQVAIWLLIDDDIPFGISPAALAIRDDALVNGDGFVPGCGQLMGIFLEPLENNAQHLMVTIPAPCAVEIDPTPRAETAWSLADWGTEFGQGWGMFFQLVDAPDAPPSEDPNSPPVVDAPPANHGGGQNSGNNGNNGNGNNGVGNSGDNGNAQGEPQRNNPNRNNGNANGNANGRNDG